MRVNWYIIFFALAVITGTLACNKDNSAAKKLDGQWKETLAEREINGSLQGVVAPLYEGGDWYIYRCKVSSKTWCDVLIQYYSVTDTAWVSYPYSYQVKDKGDSLLIKEGAVDTAFVNRFKLAKLEENSFTLEQTKGDTLLRRVFTRAE
jgi:hypothetical protein